MLFQHKFNSDCGVHIYERKYLGEGKYYQRGVAENIQEGDQVRSFTCQNTLTVKKITSVNDSKYGENLLYEAEMVDDDYNPRLDYRAAQRI